MGFYELGQYDRAQETIDRALHVSPNVQSRHLKTAILGVAAVIHAETATTATEKTLVVSSLNQAALLIPPSQSPCAVSDDNFFRCDRGMLAIYKAMVFISPNMKGFTAEKVSDMLEDAQRWTCPELVRRQTCITCLQAQVHFLAGDYQQATEVALSALEKSRQIRSRLWRNALERLYQQLMNTSYKGKSLLVYLGAKLRTWDYGMG